MRRIERTGAFKRDFKRELRGRHGPTLDRGIAAVVLALAEDRPPEVRHRDHAPTGQWRDFRDCHIKPDLVLIYRRPDAGTLQLARLGLHSELGL
jgi:mRNA interferase YafQ